jgi:putative transposase
MVGGSRRTERKEGEKNATEKTQRGKDYLRAETDRRRGEGLEMCRELGISEATLYNWKRGYAGMGVSELRRLKQLEDENRRLRGLVADRTIDKHILQEVLRKKP